MSLEQQVYDQIDARTKWRDQTAFDYAKSMVEESQELAEELESGHDDPMKVAAEIGDLMWILIALSRETGIKLDDALKMKLIRNELKYNAALLNNGNYQKDKQTSKDMYENFGGDEKFFVIYESTIKE